MNPDFERVGDLLEQLVAIDSVNPDMPGGENGENGYGDFVAEFGRSLGLAVSRQEVVDGRANVLLELDGGHERTLLFDIHLDTVPQEGELGSARPVRDGGRVFGRGACDVKGSMVSALLMLERLVRDPPPLNVALAAVVDEEYRKRGAHRMAAGFSADAVVVSEPTSLQPVIAQKGILRFAIEAAGKSAHTANPELGDNAIYSMLDAISMLRALPPQVMPSAPHPLCGDAKLTVSTIAGGVQVNVVPASCQAMVDRRMLPGEDPMAVWAAFVELFAGLAAITVGEPYAAEAGVESGPDCPIVRAAAAACRRLGLTDELVGVPYSTDAAAYAPLGRDFVVLGPGDIAQAHSNREFVELSEVAACVGLYEDLVRSFAEEDGGD
jgi:acetylornithine deacetylase